jgi:hypothetical protein
MDRSRFSRVSALILIALVAASCKTSQWDQLSDSQRWEISVEAYSGAVDTMTTLSMANQVSLETLERFELVRSRAATHLEAWGEAVEAGESYDHVASARLLIDEMILLTRTE